MNGARAALEACKREGADAIFGYPGGTIMPFYDAMFGDSDFRHYLVRHEAAAVFAASGYARTTGRVGLCCATSGPGATNLVTGVACAFADGQAVAPALYFSRVAVPGGDGPLWHHVGIYAYRRAALARFVALQPSPLEVREKLEQLRALEAGMRIAVARVDHAPFGVDTPADLARARAAAA